VVLVRLLGFTSGGDRLAADAVKRLVTGRGLGEGEDPGPWIV